MPFQRLGSFLSSGDSKFSTQGVSFCFEQMLVLLVSCSTTIALSVAGDILAATADAPDASLGADDAKGDLGTSTSCKINRESQYVLTPRTDSFDGCKGDDKFTKREALIIQSQALSVASQSINLQSELIQAQLEALDKAEAEGEPETKG